MATITTRRKETANRLMRTSEIRYRRLFEAAKDGVLILDPKTRKITDANPFMSELLGYPYHELIGKELFEIGLLKDKLSSQIAFRSLQKNHFIRYEDLPLETKHGVRREIEIVANLYKEDGRAVIQCNIRDITVRKHLEQQKDDFIGIVSHELKTPLTSLKMYVEMLQRRFIKSGDTEKAQYIANMDAQLDKLNQLINDLLDVTKLEAGRLPFHKELFDLDNLVADVVKELQNTNEQHHISIAGKLTREMYGDRERISQVLINLIANAIKYSPRAKKIEVSLSSDQKDATVSIRDFGIGIPKSKQARLFQRFYRVNGAQQDTFPGLGLGLYISNEIIKRHAGAIWVKSVGGKGATFSFTIPFQQTAAKQAKKKTTPRG